MIERPDADALMAGELGQWLAGQNDARAAAKATAAKRQKIGIAAACAVAFIIILIKPSEIGTALQFGFFVGAAGFGWAALAKRPVINAIKGGINGAIARALGLEYSAVVVPGPIFERAKAFALLPGYEDAACEDQWSGKIGEQPFTLHEAKLTEERGSGKSRRTVTLFQGQLLSIAFTRKFIGTTLIERQQEHRTWWGGARDHVEVGGLEMKSVAMVDPRFEDMFSVWSDDGVEARYLVHPEYVERLIAVQTAYAGKNIRALFHGGELLVVIETENQFESGSLEASDDRALLEQTIGQFATLAALATTLNERPRAGFN